MEREKLEKMTKMVKEQEMLLRPVSFTNTDAWKLGSFIVNRVISRGLEMAVSIRKPNGNVVFQYMTDGTNMFNQNWMDRKFMTVVTMEKSSFRAFLEAELSGEDLEYHGFNSEEFVFCGGGFPIRLKSGEFVGVLLVSALPHQEDHQFIIDMLSDYMNVKNAGSVLELWED